MESLSTIYVNSVIKLLRQLSYLKDIEVDMMFISANEGMLGMAIQEGNIQVSKRPTIIGPDPLFKIQGLYDRDNSDIPLSMMIKSEVPRYLNIPSDPIPDVERFDPLVHLEIEVPKPEVPEDQKDPNEEDEMSKPFIR